VRTLKSGCLGHSMSFEVGNQSPAALVASAPQEPRLSFARITHTPAENGVHAPASGASSPPWSRRWYLSSSRYSARRLTPSARAAWTLLPFASRSTAAT
jgi:hypothetical protein